MIKAIVCIALIGALIFSKLAWAGEAAQFENAAAADNVNGPHLVVAKLLDSSGTGLGLSVAKLLWREVYTAAESQGAPDRSLVDFVDDQSAAGLANGFHDGAAQFAKAHSAAMALWGEVIAGEDQLEVDLCLTLPSGEAVGTLRLAAQDTRHVGLTADVGLNAPIASARINFEPIITTRAALFERIIAADNDSSAHDAPRNGSSVVAEIPKGTLLHAIDVVGDWFRVQLPNGTAAYFPIIDSLVLPQTVRVDRAAIAMRAEPAEGATRLLTQIAPRDYKVDAVRMPKTAGKINFSEIWYEIHAGDLQGWVRASDVYTILGSPAIDFVLGTFLFINGNYDGAARALQAYVNSIGDSDTDPNLGAAYQILGSSQIIGKDLASLPPFAAAPFNRAIARNPYDPAPYALRAVVDLGIDRSPAAAIADLHSALDLDRDEYSARQLVAAMSSIATNGPEALRSRTGLAGATSALEQLARQYLIPVGTLVAAVEPKKIVKVGIDLSLTGPDAAFGTRINNGVLLAFDQANINHDIPGYKLMPPLIPDR
jgi:SH3-like domain-containing protein